MKLGGLKTLISLLDNESGSVVRGPLTEGTQSLTPVSL